MMEISVLVINLKYKFANIKFNEMSFDNYGIKCFENNKDLNLVYLEINLLSNLNYISKFLNQWQIDQIKLSNYSSIFKKNIKSSKSENILLENLVIINNITINNNINEGNDLWSSTEF